jgi:hypothetical protein
MNETEKPKRTIKLWKLLVVIVVIGVLLAWRLAAYIILK